MDGIVREKTQISGTAYLYGCEIGDLPVSRDDRIKMHEAQLACALQLHDELDDLSREIRRRIIKVNDAINWNRLMLEDLQKGK